MTHILKRLAAAACMTLTLGIAFAGQPLKIESITYEPQANVNGEQLLLNGAGLRTKIFFKVYTAGALPEGARPQEHRGHGPEQRCPRSSRPAARRVSCASFIDSLNDGIKANLQPAKEKAISAGLEALRSLMRSIGDVKRATSSTSTIRPDKGTTVHLNDKPVGEPIGGGRALYNAVLAIWLGDNAIDDGLKKKLFEIRRLNALKNTTARNRKVSGRLFIEGLRVIRP